MLVDCPNIPSIISNVIFNSENIDSIIKRLGSEKDDIRVKMLMLSALSFRIKLLEYKLKNGIGNEKLNNLDYSKSYNLFSRIVSNLSLQESALLRTNSHGKESSPEAIRLQMSIEYMAKNGQISLLKILNDKYSKHYNPNLFNINTFEMQGEILPHMAVRAGFPIGLILPDIEPEMLLLYNVSTFDYYRGTYDKQYNNFGTELEPDFKISDVESLISKKISDERRFGNDTRVSDTTLNFIMKNFVEARRSGKLQESKEFFSELISSFEAINRRVAELQKLSSESKDHATKIEAKRRLCAMQRNLNCPVKIDEDHQSINFADAILKIRESMQQNSEIYSEQLEIIDGIINTFNIGRNADELGVNDLKLYTKDEMDKKMEGVEKYKKLTNADKADLLSSIEFKDLAMANRKSHDMVKRSDSLRTHKTLDDGFRFFRM